MKYTIFLLGVAVGSLLFLVLFMIYGYLIGVKISKRDKESDGVRDQVNFHTRTFGSANVKQGVRDKDYGILDLSDTEDLF